MSQDHDSEIDNDGAEGAGIGRRTYLKGIGAASVVGSAALGTADVDSGEPMGLGGVPAADLSANYTVKPYVGPSNIPPDDPQKGDLWIKTDTGERVTYDGSAWTPLSLDAPAVTTEELSNTTRFISPDDSRSNIDSKLSSTGTVVFERGTHEFTDRVLFGSDNLTVIIPPGATVKYATGASPTATTLNGTDTYPLLVASGRTNVSLKNHGVINALTSDSANNRQGVVFDSCVDSRIVGGGGNVIDALVGYRLIDCEDTDLIEPESDDCLESVAELQGTVGCRASDVFADARNINMKEAIDITTSNKDFVVDGVTAIDGGGGINPVEVHESGDGEVRNIHCDNVGVGIGFRAQRPSTTDKLTSKSDRGDANNVTVNGIYGTAQHLVYGVDHGTTNDAKNASFLNVEGEATGMAIRLEPKTAGQLDGLTVTGDVKSTNSNGNPAVKIDGFDGQITDVSLDLKADAATGAGPALTLGSVDEATGVVRVKSADSHGVSVYAHGGRTCFNNNLQIVSVGAGDHGLRVDGANNSSGDGTCEDNVFTGSATNSVNADVDFSAAARNCKYVGIAPTTNDTGTGNTFI